MGEETRVTKRTLTPHAIGMIGVLVVQYVLGIFSNLFVQFPQNEHDGQLWIFAWHQIPLALHIIVGFLLLFGTLALLIHAFVIKNKTWIIAASIASVAIIAAIAGGSTFIPTQTDVYSFIMAVCFIIALFAYFWGIYKDK